MKFTVTKPSIWLYKTEDLTGEVSDELLFGTVLEILSEKETTSYVKTDYGYCGYLNRWEICECTEEDCGEADKVTVYSRCDLLCEDFYSAKPYMSIPKGSRIKLAERRDGRFSVCMAGRRALYIPNAALECPKHESKGSAIAENALSYLGVPYRWGGKSDTGIDCSGLAFMSCRLAGVQIYRDAVFDGRFLDKIPENSVAAGDFAYFKGHVAVMTGGSSYVHASASECRVVTGDMNFGKLRREDVLCYGRIKESE